MMNTVKQDINLLQSAKDLIGQGLSIIVVKKDKRPCVETWTKFQTTAATIGEIEIQLRHPYAYGLGIICGAVSGNLEAIDEDFKYDLTGKQYNNYCEIVEQNSPDLIAKIRIHESATGGKHLFYRCELIEGNQKLASRKNDNKVLFETRGEGGYIIAPPTPGYSVINDVPIPVISVEDRNILISACKYFNQSEIPAPYSIKPIHSKRSNGLTPGDDYNSRGDVVELLLNHGYSHVNTIGQKVVLLRPGQTDSISSGDFHTELRLLKMFSTSTQFVAGRGYGPFAVFAILECSGDFKLAAKKLSQMGYGEKNNIDVVEAKDLSISENLTRIVAALIRIDYRTECGLSETDLKLKASHYAIKLVEKILDRAKQLKLELCKNQGAPYLYNGSYWENIIEDDLRKFLGEAALETCIPEFTAKDFGFVEHLLRQFMFEAYMPAPVRKNDVLINFRNGTVEIDGNNKTLREFSASDFLTHKLPFDFNPDADCPMFQKFLDKVLPDPSLQMVLAEYMGYVFVPNKKLKLEKALVCYGDGSNGKSVLFEICEALYGRENMTYHTLTALTDKEGYYRATLVNKLLNYSSEIGDRNDADAFKKLISGEPVSARFPYGRPMTITNYSRFIFNCNKLPKDTEQSHAFFRRFLILPFEVIITEDEQDKQLANKIIASELSGILNWVMQGLDRLILNQSFTQSVKVDQQAKDYRQNSDSVLSFLAEQEYEPSTDETIPFKNVYSLYKEYCTYGLYSPCSYKTFSERLTKRGIASKKKKDGMHLLLKSMAEPVGFSPVSKLPF